MRRKPEDWLYRCEGFDVVSPNGRIGAVEEVRYAPSRRWDSPSELAVRAGHAGARRIIVPVEDIAGIDPDRRVVTLRSTPHIVSTEPRPGA